MNETKLELCAAVGCYKLADDRYHKSGRAICRKHGTQGDDIMLKLVCSKCGVEITEADIPADCMYIHCQKCCNR